MRVETIQFLRGVAMPVDKSIDNPLIATNPKVHGQSSSRGVYFYACSTQDHTRDAINWAVQGSTLEPGLDPYLIRFELRRDQYPLLHGRLFTFADRVQQWISIPSFDAIECEVQLNGLAMKKSDIEMLAIKTERVSL